MIDLPLESVRARVEEPGGSLLRGGRACGRPRWGVRGLPFGTLPERSDEEKDTDQTHTREHPATEVVVGLYILLFVQFIIVIVAVPDAVEDPRPEQEVGEVVIPGPVSRAVVVRAARVGHAGRQTFVSACIAGRATVRRFARAATTVGLAGADTGATYPATSSTTTATTFRLNDLGGEQDRG